MALPLSYVTHVLLDVVQYVKLIIPRCIHISCCPCDYYLHVLPLCSALKYTFENRLWESTAHGKRILSLLWMQALNIMKEIVVFFKTYIYEDLWGGKQGESMPLYLYSKCNIFSIYANAVLDICSFITIDAVSFLLNPLNTLCQNNWYLRENWNSCNNCIYIQ